MNNSERKAIAAALAEEGFCITQTKVDDLLAEVQEEEQETEDDVAAALASFIDEAVWSVYSRAGEDACRLYRTGLEDAVELAQEDRLGFGPDEEYWFDMEEEGTRQS